MRNLLVEEVRGDVVEAIHHIHGIVLRGENEILRFGNVDRVVPMRSVAKPFMLSALLNECAKAKIDISPAMISLMASSHNGEKKHRKMVEGILEMSGSSVSDLHCGSHLPYYEWLYDEFFSEKNLKKRQLFHNCSGKHAGMLLLAKIMGTEKVNYWKDNHPVQIAITKSVRDNLEIGNKDLFTLAMDGCGVPTYCVTIPKIARGFRNLFLNEALKPVFDSIVLEPFFNSGTGRIEMDIIKEYGFLAKSGSSGLFCIADASDDISIVIKVEDGHDDISEVAIVEVMAAVGLLNREDSLQNYKKMKILTSTGEVAGQYHSVWTS